jgi:hypothetical protein
MTAQHNHLVGFGGYTPEEMHAIVRRAHRQRAQAMRAFFTWLFARRGRTAQATKAPAHIDAMACR